MNLYHTYLFQFQILSIQIIHKLTQTTKFIMFGFHTYEGPTVKVQIIYDVLSDNIYELFL